MDWDHESSIVDIYVLYIPSYCVNLVWRAERKNTSGREPDLHQAWYVKENSWDFPMHMGLDQNSFQE